MADKSFSNTFISIFDKTAEQTKKTMALKLYMALLGCRPPGRFTEQHDIFFGIGTSLGSLIPQINKSWPEAKGKIHVDAFRAVTKVDGFQIEVQARTDQPYRVGEKELFFINLGGYKEGEFEEFHYKMLIVAENQGEAIRLSRQTAFFKHTGFKGAPSHIDDKYGIDVDDIFTVKEILAQSFKEKYAINITESDGPEDELTLGYFPLKTIAEQF
jgi:hypothetical protein